MKIHFIGIGGIGVSALAKYYLRKGCKITGSDLVSSEITDALKKEGVKIFIGKHKAENLPKDVQMVVYSPAVKKDNPELKTALTQHPRLVNQPQVLSYPEALGELTKKYFTIAVSGTHGKSTTAAMIGLLLTKAGFDPTVIIGTKLKEFDNSNCRVGRSKYLVIEADEWQASFLNYWPKVIVLTNIEREHLDYYKNLNNILKVYREYISHLPKNGVLIANHDDENIIKIKKQKFVNDTFSTTVKNVLYFSLGQPEAKKFKKILKIPGEHNIYNALAALAVARVLKIPDKISFKALAEYKGCWRRFQISEAELDKYQGRKARKITIISDYGHHPTEIRVTLKAAREKFPKKKIWCIFQPHQYQRTFYLFKDFVKVFKEAPLNKLIITNIYEVAGREEKEIKEKISAEKLTKAINQPWTIYLPKNNIKNYLKKNLQDREVVIIMGAGDIYKLSEDLTRIKKKKKIE